MVFHQRLKQLREGAKLTQKELAESVGISVGGLAHLEQGIRAPAWKTVQALAKALCVSCEAFSEDEPASPVKPAKSAAKKKGGKA